MRMKAKARSKAKCAMHILSIAIELRDFLGDEMKRKEDSGMCSEKISLINNFVENIDLFLLKYYCCCLLLAAAIPLHWPKEWKRVKLKLSISRR